MIKAALFDFGGVILSSPFEAFAAFEHERGLPDRFLRTVNATNPDDNAWAKLERSEVDARRVRRPLRRRVARRSATRSTVATSSGLLMGELRPAMVEAVRRCTERLKTGLLTNNFVTGDGHVDRENEMGRVMAMFDVVVESSQVGVRKPDPRFYEIACTQLDIDPSEAVFLDDLGINLKPARALGMTTIKVEDPAVAIAELEAVVGFPLG